MTQSLKARCAVEQAIGGVKSVELLCHDHKWDWTGSWQGYRIARKRGLRIVVVEEILSEVRRLVE